MLNFMLIIVTTKQHEHTTVTLLAVQRPEGQWWGQNSGDMDNFSSSVALRTLSGLGKPIGLPFKQD